MIGFAITISIVAHLVCFLVLFSMNLTPVKNGESALPTESNYSNLLATTDEADLQKHSEQLKTKLKGRGFTVLIEKPFEGLGSLYEQSGEIDGHIHGFTNWRLSGLQKAIKTKTVPTFKKLTSTSRTEFYRDDTGTNYAQARYLCYYLQQKKLLTRFYKDFLANHKTDPTGYKTLQKVLRERDMNAFQRKWQAFVLKLTVGYEIDVN